MAWILCLALPNIVFGQDLSANARVLAQGSFLKDHRGVTELQLSLSQAIPYRVFSLIDPMRIVIDFNNADFSGVQQQVFDQSKNIKTVLYGAIAPDWSRMVLELEMPLNIRTAGLITSDDGTAVVVLELEQTDAASFEQNAGAPVSAISHVLPNLTPPGTTIQRQQGDRPLIVVLDPGHGGIDPGAERGDVVEADLMLTFARELKDVLIRSGNLKVVLTREADIFVPLEARVSIARRAKADVFISLHADALVEGRASGSTIYTLSEKASDIASQKLAERHDRTDLLAGVDLSDQDDEIAAVLMAMARVETAPRTDKLADALVTGMGNAIGMHKRPRLTAGFSVLKAPDIPSVLVELGFLSSQRDRDRLIDKKWRNQAATGIRDALVHWAAEDAADAMLLRQ
ncbi:MAG: N-acetylmuramoyl-L-alanine amidase [Paracoccaceae bacterium]